MSSAVVTVLSAPVGAALSATATAALVRSVKSSKRSKTRTRTLISLPTSAALSVYVLPVAVPISVSSFPSTRIHWYSGASESWSPSMSEMSEMSAVNTWPYSAVPEIAGDPDAESGSFTAVTSIVTV